MLHGILVVSCAFKESKDIFLTSKPIGNRDDFYTFALLP